MSSTSQQPRQYEMECGILADMFGRKKFSQAFLLDLLQKSDSFDKVFECLIEFVQMNENFDLSKEEEEEEEEKNEVDFNKENVFNTKEEESKEEEQVDQGFLSDEVVKALYYEFQLKHGFQNDGDNQRNQNILYEFLEHLLCTDFQRIGVRQQRFKEGTVGKSEEDFPSFTNDKKQSQVKASKVGNNSVWVNKEKFAFKTNFKNEVAELNQIQGRLIHVDHRVLQEVYDIFCSVALVEELLKMTFPSLYNVKATSKADSLMIMAQQPRPPPSDWREVALREKKSSKIFWTKELVQKYTWAFKSDVSMQPIVQQVYNQCKQIDEEIKAIRFHMKNAHQKGDFKLYKQIKARLDQLEEERAKVISAGQEQKFAMRHTPENIHNFIDLIGYYQREAVEITQRRINLTQEALRKREIEPNIGNGIDHVYKIIAHKGNHSKGGQGVLKVAIQNWLDSCGFEYHADTVNGVFLVRLRSV